MKLTYCNIAVILDSTIVTALSATSTSSTFSTTSTITSVASAAATTSSSCAPAPNSMLDVGNDDVLSEILEGVIDIQEILPNPAITTQVTPSGTVTIPPEARKSTMSSEIENIEKFLVESSSGSTVASTAAVPISSRYQQSSQPPSHQRHKSGPVTMVTVGGSYPPPIQTTASSSESSSLAASNNNNQQIHQQEASPQQIQHRRQQQSNHAERRQNSAPGLHSALCDRGSCINNSAPVALAPRMNELLQQVPPNVSIPDCPDLVNKHRKSVISPVWLLEIKSIIMQCGIKCDYPYLGLACDASAT